MHKADIKNKIQLILLTLIVILGITKPLLKLYGFNIASLNVLNLSPGSLVFSDIRFFTEIRVYFVINNQKVAVPTSAIIDTPGTDLYKGKMKYSLLYMDHIFPQKILAARVARFYLCDDRLPTIKELNLGKPQAVRIEYVDRENGNIKMVRYYSCQNEGP